MRTVRLGEIVENLPCSFGDEPREDEPSTNVVKVSNIDGTGRFYGVFEPRHFPKSQLPKFLVRRGELLVVKSSGSKTNVLSGKTAICGETMDGQIVASNFLIRLRPDESQVEPQYLWRVLNNPASKRFVKTIVSAFTYPNLNWSPYSTLPIPLPPLPEQRRIAAILDKADELRAKRRAALEQLNGLTQSMFLEMFGDPATNPKGFPVGNVECLVKNPKGDIRCGPFGTQLKVHEITETGIPLFGIENVLDEGFNAATSKCLTDAKARQLKAFDVIPGDVLVTRMGTIGRACVVPASVSNGRFSYHLFRIRPDESRCDPDFLAATIAHSGVFQSQLRLLAHGAIMDGLSTANLRAVRFLQPPVPLQREFARRVAKVQSVKASLVLSQRTCDQMFASLQHQAFSGAL